MVGPSFGEIFQVNCIQNGIIVITLDEHIIRNLWQQLRENAGAEVTIDLPNQRLIAPDGTPNIFDISPLRKDRLLRGVDDIDVTLEHLSEIERFESARRKVRPWLPLAHRE